MRHTHTHTCTYTHAQVRLDIFEDLHILERQQIRGLLRDWIPEKYRYGSRQCLSSTGVLVSPW